ncbi:MAG: preprotein translocase subunit YajC [Clostridia bacterium]|nr:preprotein translocase subunit YajC [Clostridia bacterium]
MEKLLLQGQASLANSWWIYVVLVGLLLVMLIMPMITNRKRAKEYNEMINNINVGDTVRTVGGVIGRIVKINEKDGYKTIILETGAKGNKTTMEFDMASVYTVLNSSKKAATKEEPKAEEAKEEAKPEEKAEEAEKQEEKPAEEKKPKANKKAKKSSK